MTRTLLALLLVLLVGCATPDDDDSGSSPGAPDPAEEPCRSWAPAERIGTVEDSALNEISGLVVSTRNGDTLWVHEDSGDGPVLTALARDGSTRGTLTLVEDDGQPVDVDDNEDLSRGPCSEGGDCLVLADIGDNALQRDRYVLRRVFEDSLLDFAIPFALTDRYDALEFAYPDGSHNAEALVVEPDGSPVVITKRADGTARLYRLPADAWGEEVEASLIATVTMGSDGGLVDSVTGADLSPDGTRLVLRTYAYARSYELGDAGLDGIADAPTRTLLPAIELQGEAIAWDLDARALLHVGEEPNAPLWRLACTSD